MTMLSLLQQMTNAVNAQEATTDFICNVLLTEIPDDAEFVACSFEQGRVLIATPTQLIEHKQHQHMSSRPRPDGLTVGRLEHVFHRDAGWHKFTIISKPWYEVALHEQNPLPDAAFYVAKINMLRMYYVTDKERGDGKRLSIRRAADGRILAPTVSNFYMPTDMEMVYAAEVHQGAKRLAVSATPTATDDDDWIAKKLHATPLDYDFVVCSPTDGEIRLYSLPPRGAFGYVTLYRGNPFSGGQSPRVVIGGHVDTQIANLQRHGWQLVTIAPTCTYEAALAVLQRRTPQ